MNLCGAKKMLASHRNSSEREELSLPQGFSGPLAFLTRDSQLSLSLSAGRMTASLWNITVQLSLIDREAIPCAFCIFSGFLFPRDTVKGWWLGGNWSFFQIAVVRFSVRGHNLIKDRSKLWSQRQQFTGGVLPSPFSRPCCVARNDFVTLNAELLFQFDKLGQGKLRGIFISGSNIIYHYLGVQPLI